MFASGTAGSHATRDAARTVYGQSFYQDSGSRVLSLRNPALRPDSHSVTIN